MFAAVFVALWVGHTVGDHWVNAANAVFAFLGVSLWRGSSRQWYGWDSARVSRLAGVDVAPRNAPLGVTASRLTHDWPSAATPEILPRPKAAAALRAVGQSVSRTTPNFNSLA